MQRESDAVLLNLLFCLAGLPPVKDRLEELRWQTRPRWGFKQITALFNADVKEIADRFDQPTRTFHWSSIQRWCHEYEIG